MSLVLEHLVATSNPPKAFDVAEIIPHLMNRLEHNCGGVHGFVL